MNGQTQPAVKPGWKRKKGQAKSDKRSFWHDGERFTGRSQLGEPGMPPALHVLFSIGTLYVGAVLATVALVAVITEPATLVVVLVYAASVLPLFCWVLFAVVSAGVRYGHRWSRYDAEREED